MSTQSESTAGTKACRALWSTARNLLVILVAMGLTNPGGLDGRESACNAGDLDSIHELRRSPGEGNGYPLQYSRLENSMDRGAWRAASPWGHKESDTTERLTLWFFTHSLHPPVFPLTWSRCPPVSPLFYSGFPAPSKLPPSLSDSGDKSVMIRIS